MPTPNSLLTSPVVLTEFFHRARSRPHPTMEVIKWELILRKTKKITKSRPERSNLQKKKTISNGNHNWTTEPSTKDLQTTFISLNSEMPFSNSDQNTSPKTQDYQSKV